MNPGKRLTAVAEFLDSDKKTVDVGTDHAYLPAFLVLSGKVKQVLACDIGREPLENARRTVEKYGLQASVALRISDGLAAVTSDEAEQISICGMGGTLMASILKSCTWLCREGLRLVLQPQSHAWEVRQFLCENGFGILQECALVDMGKLYITIAAVYDGKTRAVHPGYYWFGELAAAGSDAAVLYVEQQKKQLLTRADCLHRAGTGEEEEAYLRECLRYIE